MHTKLISCIVAVNPILLVGSQDYHVGFWDYKIPKPESRDWKNQSRIAVPSSD